MNEAYIEVYAMSVQARDAESPSGDEETTFAHVSWDERGFTSSNSWYTGTYYVHNIDGEEIPVYGPLFGYTPDMIQEAISTPPENPNLNDEFQAWENSVSLAVRSGWIQFVDSKAPNCVS